jgi:hypothetical protein
LRERLLDEREPEPEPLLLLRDDEPEPLREELLRDDEPEPLPEELLRDDEPEPLPLPLRERDEEPPFEREDDDPDPLRDELLRLREDDDRLRPAGLRSAAGISSCATAFVSCGISFSRNFAIRSSSRLIPFAIFAVSLSPTRSASASIAV